MSASQASDAGYTPAQMDQAGYSPQEVGGLLAGLRLGTPSDSCLLTSHAAEGRYHSYHSRFEESCKTEDWIGYDGVTCGECTALVNVQDHGKTCEGFCALQGLACVEAWDDDQADSCSVGSAVQSCDHDFGSSNSDAICKCAPSTVAPICASYDSKHSCPTDRCIHGGVYCAPLPTGREVGGGTALAACEMQLSEDTCATTGGDGKCRCSWGA